MRMELLVVWFLFSIYFLFSHLPADGTRAHECYRLSQKSITFVDKNDHGFQKFETRDHFHNLSQTLHLERYCLDFRCVETLQIIFTNPQPKMAYFRYLTGV